MPQFICFLEPTRPDLPENLSNEESAAIAKAFMKAGVEQFDAVAIFGFNSPEWVMASQATFMTGAKTAGIYPTDTAEQIAYKWCVPLAAPLRAGTGN